MKGGRDQIEARETLTRFDEELDSGMSVINAFKSVCEKKEKSLNKILRVLKGEPIKDTFTFLQMVVSSTDLSWTQPRFPSATFEEITSSGKLGLIQNLDLRKSIAQFYWGQENSWRMADVRRGEYARIISKILLLQNGSEVRMRKDLSPEEQEEAVEAILDSNLEGELKLELNRNSTMLSRYDIYEELIIELRSKIKAELNR